jgi:GNAT superfamily N-acetyltransferase
MTTRTLTTWYLEMLSAEQLRRGRTPEASQGHALRRVGIPLPAFSRFLYTAVGGDWYWRDRLSWSEARWRQYLQRPQVETWVLSVQDTPAGYVELEHQDQGHCEIAYFGLIPAFIGRGLGGYLLGEGIARAWAAGARRVWVHTCSLDGPAALANYEARGMVQYHVEHRDIADPGQADGPWPGAR